MWGVCDREREMGRVGQVEEVGDAGRRIEVGVRNMGTRELWGALDMGMRRGAGQEMGTWDGGRWGVWDGGGSQGDCGT
jgi:hypothetical protein